MWCDDPDYDDTPVCCMCGTTENVSYGPDPYALELYDDHRDVAMCAECRYESAMDV